MGQSCAGPQDTALRPAGPTDAADVGPSGGHRLLTLTWYEASLRPRASIAFLLDTGRWQAVALS